MRTYREALLLMQDRGGNFASKLACAWLVADPENEARLRIAFPDLLACFVNAPPEAK